MILVVVTPYVGVWIETEISKFWAIPPMSHPTWVCGLKLVLGLMEMTRNRHTLRGCVDWNHINDASFLRLLVTPYVGVWIETDFYTLIVTHYLVTPYVGVWIETYVFRYTCKTYLSHPTWVCGLKPLY